MVSTSDDVDEPRATVAKPHTTVWFAAAVVHGHPANMARPDLPNIQPHWTPSSHQQQNICLTANLLIKEALRAHKAVLEPGSAVFKGEGQHHAVTIKGVTLVTGIGDLPTVTPSHQKLSSWMTFT